MRTAAELSYDAVRDIIRFIVAVFVVCCVSIVALIGLSNLGIDVNLNVHNSPFVTTIVITFAAILIASICFLGIRATIVGATTAFIIVSITIEAGLKFAS